MVIILRLAIFPLVLTLVGCASNRSQMITERPTESVMAFTPTPANSRITADLVLPLSGLESFVEAVPKSLTLNDGVTFTDHELTQTADSMVPQGSASEFFIKSFSSIFRLGYTLFPALKPTDLIINWSVTVSRKMFQAYPLPDNQQICFDELIGVKGHVKYEGPLKFKLLNDGEVMGLMRLKTNVGLYVDPSGNAALSITHEPQWVQGPLVGMWNGEKINLGMLANKLIPGMFAVSDRVSEEGFSKVSQWMLLKYWKAYQFPLEMLGNEKLYANIKPVSLSLSGTKIEENGSEEDLHFVASLAAQTSIDSNSTPLTQPGLPKVVKIPVQPGKISFLIPIHLDYQKIISAIKQTVVNKPRSVDNAEVRILDICLYPSQKDLVIGVDLATNFHREWWDILGLFNVTGWVYMKATPTIDPVKGEFYLDHIQLTQQMNNPLWVFAAGTFYNSIIQEIAESSRINLKSELDGASQSLSQTVADATKDQLIPVTLENSKLSVKVIPLKDLLLEVGFSAKLTTKVDLNNLLH